MATDSSEDQARLHHLNALFAHITGHDLYLAEQIRNAIALSVAELEAQTAAHPESADTFDAAFNQAAARLVRSFFEAQPEHGFFHWDALQSANATDPLFFRAELMAGLKSLAPYRESTLLITNLRPALLPEGVRHTLKRRQQYEDMLAYVRELSAARTTRSARLHLLFL